jgi:lipopolysaccharide export LptBFGC system permease protein LptF
MLYRRHIFFAVLWTAACATCGFVLLFLACSAFRDLSDSLGSGNVGFALLLRTLWTFLPFAFAYALPLGAVLAVLAAIGRMAADGEILALETAGVSRRRIALPIFAFACLCGFISLAVTIFAAPRALYGYRRQLREFVFREPHRLLQPGHIVREFPGRILYAGGKRENALTNLHIWELDSDGEPTTLLRAARGEFLPPASAGALRILLKDGLLEKLDGLDRPALHFGKFSLALAEEQLFPTGHFFQKSIKHMNLFELIAARRTLLLSEGHPELRRRECMAISFTIQQNLSMAFSVIPLSLIAFHLAARLRRREMALNGLVAIFLCLSHYFVATVLSWLRDSPATRPDCLIWAPNALLLFFAGSLLLKK